MIAKRLATIKPSGVRRIFDLARTMGNPINLSIGEPDFDIPGPGEIIQNMTTLQQYSFTCAPSFAQKAATKALDYDVSELIEEYRRKGTSCTKV